MSKKPSSGIGEAKVPGGLLSGQLAGLRAQFRNRLQSDRQSLEHEHAAALEVAPDRAALQRLLRLAHGLHGVGASFGYAHLGASAAAVEATSRAASDAPSFAYAEHLGPLVATLLTDLDAAIADE